MLVFISISTFFIGDFISAAENEISQINPVIEMFKDKFETNGYLENETAHRVNAPHIFPKVQNIFQLETWFNFSDEFSLYGLTWLKYDAAYESNNYSDEASREYKTNFKTKDILRELYVEGSISDLSFRLGRQQVIWGEAVGLKITDIINPQDLREFILDDFIDSRVPLWMLKLEYSLGKYDIENLFIPDFEPDRPAETGSEWSLPSPFSYPQQPISKPGDGFESTEIGLRLSRFLGGWDISSSYFYTWDDSPALHIKEEKSEKKVFPEHHRHHTLGFTFNNAFGKWVPQGEFAFNIGKFFRIEETEVAEGVTRKNNLFYMTGADYTVNDNLLVNGQFIQQIIFNYEEGIIDDAIENIFSIFFQSNFMNETLKPDLLILYDANDGVFLIRPKAAYDLTDKIKLTLGADIIEGEAKGFIGQFNNNDRIYFETKYSF